MQSKPKSWPVDGPVELLPEIFLDLLDSPWPPARDGAPTGTAALGSWSVDRDLTGAILPGQVRAASGFSIASGSAVFAQPEGAPLSPRGRGNRRVGAGGKCILYASHAGPDRSQGLALGSFVLAPISGSSSSIEVTLELEEDSIRLRRPLNLAWTFDAVEPRMDAAWVLSEIARINGYRSVPFEYADSIQASAPLLGRAAATNGKLTAASGVVWVAADSMIGLGPGASLAYSTGITGTRTGFYLSAMVSGRGGMLTRGGITVDVRAGSVILRQGASTITTITLPAAKTVARAVKVNVTRTSATTIKAWTALPGDTVTTYAGEFTVPIALPTWSDADPITVATDISNGGGTTSGRWIRGVKVHHRANFDFPAFEVQARIEPTGSALAGIFDLSGKTAWAAAQEIAAATLGAVWISEAGQFTYRNRAGLRGAGQITETVEALDSIESLNWVIDPAEISDRVQVDFQPAEVNRSSTQRITLWEATEPVRVPAMGTVTLHTDISGTTDRLAPFKAIWDESEPAGQYSRWAASSSSSGDGERPADDALTFRVELLTPTRISITITNATPGTLWLVDGTGTPTLILRTSLQVTPGEPESISAGKRAEEAQNEITFSAGAWVQDVETAQRILNWAAGQTSTAQAVINHVRVVPDLSRQLGDIILLTDGHSGLRTKAIIKGIQLSGDSTGYTQTLNIALLDLTFDDYDVWLQGQGINTFDALDAQLRADGIYTFTAYDQWGEDLGGTL